MSQSNAQSPENAKFPKRPLKLLRKGMTEEIRRIAQALTINYNMPR